MTSSARPIPAARRINNDKQTNSSTASTGLLINVIRTLTSSVSEDQRELEKTRLEKGFKESGAQIDKLVKAHQKDVEECLESFRDVSTRISSCKERIHNVRNALQTCKLLLECRRDDLKKLWLENARQKHICQVMAQLDEIREAPLRIDIHIANANYQEAARILSTSRDLLNGGISSIGGLSQLKLSLDSSARSLADKIIEQIVELLVVDPFEQHMMDIVASMGEQRILESEQCSKLAEKAKRIPSTESLSSRLAIGMAALAELRADDPLGPILHLSKVHIEKQALASTTLMRTKASIDENMAGDQTHLAQLIQMIVAQLESCRIAHSVLAEITATSSTSQYKVMPSFWSAAQTAVETLVSDHLDLAPSKEPIESTKKQLFRFDATAFASSTSSGTRGTQNCRVVCTPSAFNMMVMFPWLRKLIESIEKATGEQTCQLRRFVHSFVMELLVERVKARLSDQMESALRSPDVRSRINNNSKVLPSCERVLELCRQVHELIVNMDLYADRFAALWLLILTEYNKHVTEMYEKTTLSLSESETGGPSRRKISAAWAADEDISRLLMSLPNWQMAVVATPNTPTTPAAAESEMEIRQRNERESEILIGNLGTQKHIERAELVTDLGDVRALAALHESLRWFAVEVRQLVSSLPDRVKENLKNCTIQVKFRDGAVSDHEPVQTAIEDCVKRLEAISHTCLLMLHLELRVHCFFHLLPLARPRNISTHEEIDPEVMDLARDLQSFHQLLSAILSQPKLRYIFDGLGHLCASIFIHSSQHMPRLSEAGKKRVCRNVWGVQQRLSQLTNRREAELDRARAFFELLAHEPDRLLAVIPDRRAMFSAIELGHLLALSVRSHPTLASQYGALEQRQAQLDAILRQPIK